MERKGNTADRCELNRQIKADNAFLRELRRQMERITKAVLDTIPAIARPLMTCGTSSQTSPASIP